MHNKLSGLGQIALLECKKTLAPQKSSLGQIKAINNSFTNCLLSQV